MEIGSIEEIPIREVWEREDTDFTPWLSKNLRELEKKLDIHAITNITTEEDVGDFRCDITGNIGDKRIIIENMYEKSDHGHLGKCITYASMLKADYIVFIAEKFRDEHLTAIDWLNEQFKLESAKFFAVKISAIKIGDSKPAPLFTIIKEPDIKIKEIELERTSIEISALVENRKKFWIDFIKEYAKDTPSWKDKKPTNENYLVHRTGRSRIGITARIGEYPTVSIGFDTTSKEKNQKIFSYIKEKYMTTIEQKLGLEKGDLDWRSPGDGSLNEKVRYTEILVSADFKIDFKNSSEKENLTCKQWLVKNMKKFYEVFTPILEEFESL